MENWLQFTARRVWKDKNSTKDLIKKGKCKGVNKLMKIYLASPFFNNEEIEIYNKVIELLRLEKLDVFVPREHSIPNGWDLPNHLWAENVFAVDYLALSQCDIVVVLNFGMYSDSGTAWECGCAYAMGKQVVNVLCSGKDAEYSLMMLNGTSIVVDLEEFENLLFHQVMTLGKEKNIKFLQK